MVVTTVAYSKEPALPGKEIALEVVYKAEHPEHFDKTITVYCQYRKFSVGFED